MLETLNMADVPSQGPVNGAAVRADQHPPVDGGPAGGAGPAVRTDGKRVTWLCFVAEHGGDVLEGDAVHVLSL